MNESKVVVKSKEMEYSKKALSSEVLYLEMSEDGYGICIVNCRHDHPCGYVTFPGIEKVGDYDNFYVKNAEVHGGFTFLGKLNPDLWKELWAYVADPDKYRDIIWIGWDYAHLGDYALFDVFDEGHKWTTDEVLAEAKAIMKDIRAGEYDGDTEDAIDVDEFVVESENPDITYIKDEIEKLEKFYERVSSTMSNYERIMARATLVELRTRLAVVEMKIKTRSF